MTITLPSDAETERLARRLAETSGKPLPQVVREAIEAKAKSAGLMSTAAGHQSKAELLARMTAITDHFAALPVLDARSADEIIGYDKDGVPR